MKVMHVGQQVRATHSLTSSRPSGWIVRRGSHGVITKVLGSESLLYTVEFRVFTGTPTPVTVKGIGNRDIVPLVPAQRVGDQSLPMVS